MDRRSKSLPCISLTLVFALLLALPLTASAQQIKDRDSHSKKASTEGVDKDNPLERLRVQEEQNGKITPAYRDQVFREAQKHNQRSGRDANGIVMGTPGQSANGPAWVNIGPFGQQFGQNGSFTGQTIDSGRLRTILVHPTDGNTVYVLSSGGGLWKTSNFESAVPSWTPLTDFLPTTAGGAAAFGRVPATIYLGLGDPFDQVTVGGSVVKSTDSGATWSTMIPLGTTVSIRDVKVDTSAATDVVMIATDGGLWRSTDGGATYNQVTGFPFQDQYIWSLVKTSAGWLMNTQESQAIPNGSCTVGTRWCTGAGHIYLSTDTGATWVEQTNGLSNFGRTTLGIGAEGDAIVYAFAALPNAGANPGLDQRDLFRSTDGGKTWVALGVNSTKTPTNPQPLFAEDMNVMSGQAYYNQTILVDPTDPTRNTVIIGGTLFSARTTDGGVSWKVLSEWLPGWAVLNGLPALPYVHADMHAMAYKSAGTPAVLLGSDGGIFAANVSGDNWTSAKNNNLADHMFYTVIGNPAFPNFAMGGLQDNGTRVRADNTGNFNQSLGGDGFGVGFSQGNAETSLQSVYNLQIRRARTQLPPKNYTEMQDSLDGTSDGGFFTPIFSPSPVADPSGQYFFSYGAAGTTGRIFLTSDGGLTWAVLNQIGRTGSGLPAGTAFRDNPFGFGMSPTNMNHMAIGANGGRCFVSLDGGVTWVSNLATNSVAGWAGFVGNVTWGTDTTIWVTSTSQAEGAGTVRVVKSTDQGVTWAAAATGLPDVPVNKIQVDPRDSTGNTAYAGTHLGIYRTTDGGATWTPFGSALPNVRVNDIYMPPDGGYIRIATYGRGIWQLSNLDYVGAILIDDGNTCDHDGNLGNNETGHLTLTFSNPGSTPVNGATVTVTSDNPHLTFTAGNTFNLPTIQPNTSATATFQVKVVGAVGIENSNLTIGYGTPVATIKQPIAINYDDKANASGSAVTFESKNHGWTISSAIPPRIGDVFAWERRELTAVHHTMAVTDANGNQDTSLVSPALQVGAAGFSFSFHHRYNFESGWDGGILEISTDGVLWTQIPAASITVGPYNSTLNTAAGGNTDVLAGLSAYSGTNVGWPAYVPATVDLGTTYANQTIHIRFRAGADGATGSQGWEISDMAFTGLTNTPFGNYVVHNEACASTVTLVSLPNPSVINKQVTFTATVGGGVTPATGTMTFKEGAAVLGSSAAVAGVASLNIATLNIGTHNVVASFAGDAGHAPSDSAVDVQTVVDIPITITGTTAQTVSRQTAANFPLTLKASSAFAGTVNLTCTGAPALTTCSFSNAAPTLVASGTANVTVTVTPAPTTASLIRTGQLVFAMFGLVGLMLIPLTRKEAGRRVLSMILLALLITVSVGGMAACGGGSKAPVTTFAAPGTYTLTVTASSGGTALQSQALTLTLQ